MDVAPAARRRSPFELRPARLQADVTIKPPDGFALAGAAAASQSAATNRFFAWNWESEGGAEHRTLSVTKIGGKHQPVDYAAYGAESRQLLEQLNAPVTINAIHR